MHLWHTCTQDGEGDGRCFFATESAEMGAKYDTVSSVGCGQCLRYMVWMGQLRLFVVLAYHFGHRSGKLNTIMHFEITKTLYLKFLDGY